MPIFSERYWQGRDFEAATLEAPLGSGPYKVGRFETGRFIELDRVQDYWAKDLPVNVGQNNFDHIRYEYFRDRTVAFEAFKNGTLNFQEEFTSRTLGNRLRLPGRCARGASRRRPSPTMRPPPFRAGISTPGARLSRIRASARPSAWRSISSGPTPTSCSDRTSVSRRISRTRDMKAEGNALVRRTRASRAVSRRTFRRQSSANLSCRRCRMDRVRTGSSFDVPTSFCARPGASAKERC